MSESTASTEAYGPIPLTFKEMVASSALDSLNCGRGWRVRGDRKVRQRLAMDVTVLRAIREGTAMDRNEVAAVLGRERSCASVERAMAVVSEGWDLVAVHDGGSQGEWERTRAEHPGARLVVLARGRTPATDRIGVFRPRGWTEPRMF